MPGMKKHLRARGKPDPKFDQEAPAQVTRRPRSSEFKPGHSRTGPLFYRPEFAKTAAEMCVNGAVISELAEQFGVTIGTIQNWRARYPEFRDAVRDAGGIADERVEMSLYHRAVGYSHEDVDIKVVDGKVVKTPIIKHYPPDTESMIFWLTNRRPDRWKRKTEVEHSGWIASLTDQQLDEKIKKLAREVAGGPVLEHEPAPAVSGLEAAALPKPKGE